MDRLRSRLLGTALLALAAVLPPAGGSLGQGLPASLIADQVTYDRDTRQLIATGNVQVLYQGRVLRANRIVYDEAADQIRAEGPLVLTDPTGGVILAEEAALTPDLTEGLISSARVLVDGQLQLAATEVRRTGGRYATLYRTIASSCTVCAENPTPTWAIRASRVTQDEVAQRIYLENARVEIIGLPVFFTPWLSIPQPGVTRASGLLDPRFQQSDIYGAGFKLPYYRVLGPSADATITPFVTTTGAALVEGEYRRRFTNGGFDFWGVVALNDGLDDGGGFGRGAFRTVGAFALDNGFIASFDLNAASDESFLTQFDYSDDDLLTSVAGLQRTRAHDFFQIDTVAFQSLTDDDDTVGVPFVLPELTYRRLFDSPMLGGRLGIEANSLGIVRREGSNMLRGGGAVDWQANWTLPRGILASGTAMALFDVYQVWENPTLPDGLVGQASPTAAIELRWPWVRSGGGVDHVIEPIVQVVWSDVMEDQNDIPNEDSQIPEFDETNLFSLSRFPGIDRLETGLRANIGISYTREDPTGWSMGVTLGQVVRSEPDPFLPPGLSEKWSDYIAAVSVDFDWGLSLVNRALFDTSFDFRRNEFAMAYDGERGALRAAYVYLSANDDNPLVGPQPETSEISLDARFRVRPNWELRGLWRYDVASHSNLRAGGGITYGNECAEFELSVSRRYTSSNNVPPSTSFGFNLRLAGVGESSDRKWPARVCMARGT